MSLPNGWAEATIEDTSELVRGVTYDKQSAVAFAEEGFVAIIRATNIQKRMLDQDDLVYVPEAFVSERQRLQASDIVVATSSGSRSVVGKSARATIEHANISFGAFCGVIRPAEILLGDWIARVFQTRDYRRFVESVAIGTNINNFRSRDLSSYRFPLPPLAEQRRIVAKLDVLTARLARARAELDRVPVLAEALRLASLRDAFHWDDSDEQLPEGWACKRMDEIGSVQLGRQRSPKDHDGTHMRPYVRAANITWNGWDLSDVKEMNFTPDEFEIFRLRDGDVLLNEGSGSAKEIGKPAVWKGEMEGVCFQNTLLRVRPFDYIPELLRYCLLYVALSGQFIKNTKGVNIIHIGKAGLAKTQIPVPPRDQQEALLGTLKAVFARADRLEAEAARARALLDRLESAILAKAFRGELVPQDPNDEPASVLLDRIRARRAAAPKAKRGRRAKASADA